MILFSSSGGAGKVWMKEKDETTLIPVGLRERDFKMFPAKELKKDGPKFGCNAGLLCKTVGLLFGFIERYVAADLGSLYANLGMGLP